MIQQTACLAKKSFSLIRQKEQPSRIAQTYAKFIDAAVRLGRYTSGALEDSSGARRVYGRGMRSLVCRHLSKRAHDTCSPVGTKNSRTVYAPTARMQLTKLLNVVRVEIDCVLLRRVAVSRCRFY